MLRMLLQVSTTIEFLSGLVLWSNTDEKTPADEQGQVIDARLPELWLRDIPHCTLRCLYGPALACGCAYSDFDCICRAFSEIADNDDIKTCITACPHNDNGRWAPGRILDFCQLVTGDDIRLPYYMGQYARLHRRRAIPVADFQEDATSYSDFSYYESSATTFITTLEPTAPTISPAITSATSFVTTLGATTATTTEPVNTSASTTSVSASSSPSPSPSGGGLSTGAKAGIGVAVPLVVIGILLGIIWFRRRQTRDRNFHRGTGNDNLPDMRKGTWSKNLFPTAFGPLPAEADSNPIHEPDSNTIHEFDSNPASSSGQLRGSDTTSPIVYELSAQPSTRTPPAAVLASTRRDDSTRGPGFTKKSSTNDTLSQISLSSPVVSSNDPNPATARRADTATLDNTIGNTSSTTTNTPSTPTVLQHQSLDSNQEQVRSSSAKPEKSIDTELLNLEAEIARVREQRERLQHLQLLEEREEQLRKEIEARKSGLSRNG